MRGPMMTESGSQERREPPFKGARGRAEERGEKHAFGKKGKRGKSKKKGKRPAFGGGPLHDAMVQAAT